MVWVADNATVSLNCRPQEQSFEDKVVSGVRQGPGSSYDSSVIAPCIRNRDIYGSGSHAQQGADCSLWVVFNSDRHHPEGVHLRRSLQAPSRTAAAAAYDNLGLKGRKSDEGEEGNAIRCIRFVPGLQMDGSTR
jgi:hypothetical protein